MIAVLGTGVGLGIGYALAHALRGLLFGVPPTDPSTLMAAAGLLLVTAVLAAWLPVRRASRIDPAISLREAPP